MSLMTSDRRMGPFVPLIDNDGVRHAIRLGAVVALCDANACGDTTVMLMAGGRVLLVPSPTDTVMPWFV